MRGKSRITDFTDTLRTHYFTPTEKTTVADIAYTLIPHLNNTTTMRFYLQLSEKNPSFVLENDDEQEIERFKQQLQQNGLTYTYTKNLEKTKQPAPVARSQIEAKPTIQTVSDTVLGSNALTGYCNSTIQSPEHLAAYHKTYAQHIMNGGKNLYDIVQGTTPEALEKKYVKINFLDYMNQILVGAAWFAYAEELNTGTTENGFKEGTFIFEDNNGAIYNAFHHYIKLLKNNRYVVEQGILNHWDFFKTSIGMYIQNPFGGYRNSTHPGTGQFGVDIVNATFEDQIGVLPCGKLHLLVSQITLDNGNKLTLLKMENYGIHKPEHLKHHGAEFVTAQATKNATLRWMFGLESDDAETNKKERVPREVCEKIAELTQKFPNMNEETKKLLAKTAKTSIANTLVILQSAFAQENDVELKSALSRVIHYIKTEFNNATKRMGNEVFITREDILVSGYYYHLLTANPTQAGLYKPIAESFNVLRKQIAIAEKNNAEVSEECIKNARTFVQALQAFSAIQNDALYTYLTNIAAIIKASDKQKDLKSFLTSDLFVKENQDTTINVLLFQKAALDAGNRYLEEVAKTEPKDIDYPSISGQPSEEEKKKHQRFIQACQDRIGTKTTPLHFDTIRTLLPETAKTDFKKKAQATYTSVFKTISEYAQSSKEYKNSISKTMITTIESAYSTYVATLIELAQKHKLYTGRAQNFDKAIFDYYYRLLKQKCDNIYTSWSPDPNSLEKEDYKKAYAKLQTQLRIILASFQNHLALWKTYDECQQGFEGIYKGIMTTLDNSFPTFDAVTKNAQQDMAHNYIKKLMELRTKYNQKNLNDSWVADF